MIETLQEADFEKVDTDAYGKFTFTNALVKLRRSIKGLHNKIAPVFVMNDVANPVNVFSLQNPNSRNGVLVQANYTSTQTTTTAFTTSATLRTFVTGYSISWQSNVTADNVTYKVLCTPAITGAANTPLIWEEKLSLTATDRTKAINFSDPIELKAATTLLLSNIFTVGAATANMIIYGYTQAP